MPTTGFRGYFFENEFPKKERVILFAEMMVNYLFPIIPEASSLEVHKDVRHKELTALIQEILSPKAVQEAIDCQLVSDRFFTALPSVKQSLLKDAAHIIEFDPAAASIEEVVLTYPGFFAIMVHRFAHILYELKVPVIPRMISEWSHSKTGIDINPGATIGCPFLIDHGTGVVIGETCVIGNAVKIYQGVTLGALAVRKEDATVKRHPTIEDAVTIYAGSTILGGNTVIGHDSIIGGNTWITESVRPHSVVYHKNQIVVSDRSLKNEPINFVI